MLENAHDNLFAACPTEGTRLRASSSDLSTLQRLCRVFFGLCLVLLAHSKLDDSRSACIESLNPRELELSGRKFTWANSAECPTFERLDRILVSTDWEQKFPLSTVEALTKEI